MEDNDDSGLIYGLEFQCRSLCSVGGDSENVRFLVGTQSLKQENQIHELELDDDTGTLSKSIYIHSIGQVWDLATHPSDSRLFSTRYSDSHHQSRAAVWKKPNDDDDNGDELSDNHLELRHKLDVSEHGAEVNAVSWKPEDDGRSVMVLVDNKLTLHDLNRGKISDSVGVLEGKGNTKLMGGCWNPHQNCSQYATVNDYTVRGWDVRSMKQASWVLENPGNHVIRSMDFNPNKQYYLATGGDDAYLRFWDIRSLKSPVKTESFGHSHWIWAVRYNQFHDQLLLTSSSDFRVVLSSMSSISSEPYGHLDEEEEDDSKGKSAILDDGIIKTFEDHEDSVYVAEWSHADPWTFASLSYDGRLVINHVPREIKFKILNLV